MGASPAVPMAEGRKLLILGGTHEARALARHAVRLPGLSVTTSLAGRTSRPAALEGEVRIGGFGGADGLAAWLGDDGADWVIDATHPFATEISRNGALACEKLGLPRLVLERPPWRAGDGDNWIEVDGVAAAAAAVEGTAKRVFLTLGARALDPFANISGVWFLVRTVEAIEPPPSLAACHTVTGRGPFDAAHETELLRQHRIDCVVSRNSGGDATYAKIEAARKLNLPVVMLRRPPPQTGETAATVEAAMDWLRDRLAIANSSAPGAAGARGRDRRGRCRRNPPPPGPVRPGSGRCG